MRRVVLVLISVLALLGGAFALPPAAGAASVDPTSVTATAQGLNAAVSWVDGASAGVTGYLVSTSPRSPTVTVPPGAASAVLTGLRPGIGYTVQVAALTAAGTGTEVSAPGTVRTVAPGGSFTGVTPARLLDTRSGFGAPAGPTRLVALAVTGRGGVPSTGVSAVALNVTVTEPQAAGFVTAYPAGTTRPLASDVNYTAGETVANSVVVPVSSGGAVDLYASAPTQLVADVSGYYTTTAAASPVAGLFHPLPPTRLLDTRTGTGGTAPGTGGTVDLQVTGQGPVPDSGVSAVVLNVTATAPTSAGFVTAYPTGAARPTASLLNFTPGQTVANRILVPVGKGGQVSLYNHTGRTQLVADITGWYTDGTDASAGGSYFAALTPHRLVDTRNGTGAPRAPLGPAGVLPIQVAGVDGVPAADARTPATAAVLTATLVDGTAGTFATVYPSLAARPATSDLNAVAGQVVPNLCLPGLGVDGAVDVFNHAGSTDLVVDLSGYFVGDVHSPSSTVPVPAGAVTAVAAGTGGPASVTFAPGAAAPEVGQVLASGVTPGTPSGLLAQVTAVGTDASGNTVASVAPATLQQALGDTDIAVAAPLGAGDLVSVRAAPGVVSSAAAGRGGVIGPAQLRARSLAAPAADPVTASATQSCSGDATSSVKVTDSFTPELVFEAAIGHRGWRPTVTAKAGIDVSEQTGLSVAFSGKVSCSWSKRLASYTFKPVVFDVAGVPVVIVPVFTLTMNGDAHGSAQLSASTGQTIDAQAGIAYANGSVSPYQSLTHSFTHTGPSVTAAQGGASVSLTGDLEGKLYGTEGPEASLTGTLALNADPTASPWWTLDFTLTADAALHISVLFAHIDASARFTLLTATLAQAATSAGSSPPVIITTELPYATVGQAYRTALTTADHRTGSWTLASGSLPTGLTLSGYTISGTPTTAGTASFTLQFTDTEGHTVRAPATLVVEPGSGGPTTGTISGRITDAQGDPLSGVEVSLVHICCDLDPIIATSTAADGGYTLTGVTPGTPYAVCFDPTDATGGTSDATGYVFACWGQDTDGSGPPTTVEVSAGQALTGVSTYVVPGGAMSGTVTGSTGSPLAYAGWASILEYAGGLVPVHIPGGWIGADGTYTIKGIAQGTYGLCFLGGAGPISASFTGYDSNCYGDLPISSAEQTLAVTAGETDRGLDGSLGEGAALTGTVTGPGGAGLGGVQVTAEGVSGTDPAGYAAEFMQATTDSSGRYTLGNLTPGTDYQVCFDGSQAVGPSAPYGYGSQCYNGVADPSAATLVNEKAGQYLTGIDGRLAVRTSAPAAPAAAGAGRARPPVRRLPLPPVPPAAG